MSKEQLLQKCVDTITENCTKQELFEICFQMLYPQYESCIIAAQESIENDFSHVLSLMNGDTEDILIISGSIFKECKEALEDGGS
jgi:hypothetical protein